MHLFLALGLLIVCGMVDATFYSPRSQTFNQLMERRQRSISIPYSYGYHYNPIEPSINVLDSLSEGLDSRINPFKPIYHNLKISTHDENSVPRTQYQPKNSLYDSEYISKQDIPSLFPEEDSYDYKYLGLPLNKYLTRPSTQESNIAINLVAIKKTSVFDYGFPTYKSPYSSVSVWNFGSKIPKTVFGDPQSVESDLGSFKVSSPTVRTVKLLSETSEQESIITTTTNDELNYKTTQETLTEAELYPTTSEEFRTEDEPSFLTTEETLTEDKSNPITSEETQTEEILTEDKSNSITTERIQTEDDDSTFPPEDESNSIEFNSIKTEDKSNSITTERIQTEDDDSTFPPEDESNSIEFNSIKTEDKSNSITTERIQTEDDDSTFPPEDESNSITTEENQKRDDDSMSTFPPEATTAFNLNYAFDTNRYLSSHDSLMLKLRDILMKIEDQRKKSQFRTVDNIPAKSQSNLSSDERLKQQLKAQLTHGVDTYEEY